MLVRECGCVRGCGCVSARVPRPGVRVARGVGRRDEPCVCPCACVCSARVWMAVALLLLPRYCDLAALWLVLCLAGTPGPRPCASASALMPVSLCSRLYGALGEGGDGRSHVALTTLWLPPLRSDHVVAAPVPCRNIRPSPPPLSPSLPTACAGCLVGRRFCAPTV